MNDITLSLYKVTDYLEDQGREDFAELVRDAVREIELLRQEADELNNQLPNY
jgi:cell fate regulator YaaT (PSP1 superfamily)